MPRRVFRIWELLVVLALIIIAAMILYPAFERAKWNSKKAWCPSNLKQVALGIVQYTQDWDGIYPPVNVSDTNVNEKNPLGWADAISPYIRSPRIFWCPDQTRNRHRDEEVKLSSDRDFTDYFYNRRLAGAEAKTLKKPSVTILFGDGNDGTDAANARYSLSTLPAAWRKDKNSPAYRHLEGANYAFADGHVKWIKPDSITDKKPDANTYTFAVK